MTSTSTPELEMRSQYIILPTAMAEEIESVVQRRSVTFGDVCWLAWELAKESLLEKLPASISIDVDDEEPETFTRPKYRQCLPPWFVEAPASAVSDLPRKLDENGMVAKVELTVRLPVSRWVEIRDVAVYRDGSLSRVYEEAYLIARPYVIGWREAVISP